MNRLTVWGCAGLLLVAGGCSRQAKESRHLRQAGMHFQAGDYDRAEIEYLNALRLNRTNLVAMRQLGQIALEQGRLSRAFGLFSQTARLWPEDFETRLRVAQLRLPGGRTPELHAEAERLATAQPTNADALALWVDSCPATNDLAQFQRRLTAFESRSGGTAGYHVALGTLLVRQRQWEAAEQAFRRALAIDARGSRAHLGLGTLYSVRGDPTRAGAEFHLAAELAPARSGEVLRDADFKVAGGDLPGARARLEGVVRRAPDYLPAQLRLAQLALDARQFAEADKTLRLVLARDPAQLDAMLMLARLHAAMNAPEKAQAELENALKVFPRLPQVHHQLAVLHVAQGKLSEAIHRLNEALALQPDHAESTLLLAELNLRRGEATTAVEALKQLVRRQPDLARGQLLLAAAHQGLGNRAEALQVYDEMARRSPTNALPAFLRGLVLKELGRTAEAKASFERALELDGRYAPAVEQLAFMALANGRPAEAEALARRHIDRAPASTGPQLLLARLQFAQTNLVAAEATLGQVLRLEPDSQEAHLLLAQVYVAGQKHTAAITEYEALVARNTNDAIAWMRIGELQMAASNYPAAVKAYTELASVNPKSGPAFNNLAWLQAEYLGDARRAIEWGNRARDLLPDDPSTADTVGWVAFRNGDYPRALALLKESAQKLGQHPEVLFHLGMAHYMMGEEIPARIALENSIQLSPDASWAGQARRKLRVLSIKADSDPEAIALLQQLRQAGDQDPVVEMRLGAAHRARLDTQSAIAAFERAIEMNPGLVNALVELARVLYYEAGETRRALELVKRARAIDQAHPAIAHLLGKLTLESAQSAADYELALGLLRGSVAALANDPEARFDYARAAYCAGQISNGVAIFESVAAMQPPSKWSGVAAEMLELEKLRQHPRDVAAQSERLRSLTRGNPPSLPAMLVLAQWMETSGQYPAAREQYEQVWQRFPLFFPVHQLLARVLASPPINDGQAAYEHAVKAREADPKNLDVARLLGRLAFKRGEFGRAVQLLEESIQAYTDDAELFFDLGIAYFNLKQGAKGAEALRRALALAPNSPRAATARQLLTK